MTRRRFLSIVLLGMLVLSACSSSSARRKGAATSNRVPNIDPADFSPTVDNPWFPLHPGSVAVFTGTKDGKASRDVVTVTSRTKVLAGVTTRVVEDRLYLDGTLEESTSDYYSQRRDGSVWYFGEDTKTLDEKGNVTGTEGTWHSGVDGAVPGIFMPAHPAVGQSFRQEYLKGHAEDHFQILDLAASVTVPYRAFSNAMLTKEWTPLEPDVLDHKYYVRGIGEVQEKSVKGAAERLDLVSFRA